MSGRRRHLPIIAGALVVVGSLLVSSPGPAAGSGGACPGTTGVTVVVDYQALGGGVVVACAPGSPSSGFDALKKAGFTIEEVSTMVGFLCRIDGKPGPPEDCIGTPPASSFWKYWYADRGGTWKVSPEGGKTRRPPPGSVDGWSFSNGPPSISPPSPSATPKPTATATPKPTTKATPTPTLRASTAPVKTATPTARPTPAPTSVGTPVKASSAAPPDPTDSPTPPPAPSSTASDRPTAAVADASPTASAVTVAAVIATTSSGGLPIGTLVGFGLVVLVGAGALSARRRRSAREASDG